MSESDEQKLIVAHFRKTYPQHVKALRVSQTGGYKGKGRQGAIRAALIKAMGGVTGEADLCILVPRKAFGCLIIEHKADGSSHKASKDQLDYLSYHTLIGNCAVLTRGVDAAIAAIDTYMVGRE
jgi:hypothetical protein